MAQTRQVCHVDGITWLIWIPRQRQTGCQHCCTGPLVAPGCLVAPIRVVLWPTSGGLSATICSVSVLSDLRSNPINWSD